MSRAPLRRRPGLGPERFLLLPQTQHAAGHRLGDPADRGGRFALFGVYSLIVGALATILLQ